MLGRLSETINNNYPNVSKNLAENYFHYSNKFNDNYSVFSSKFNESYPTLSSSITNTTSSITTKFNDGTTYIYSLPASIGGTFNSILEPVNVDGSEEREIARIPPNESLDNNVIPLTGDREKIINNILDLYCCKASKECFEFYDDNVIYDDLIIYTAGLSNIKAHFYGIQKLFVKSTTESYKILENTPNVLRLTLSQKYTLPYVSRAVVYNSEIILELNENKISKHVDRWHGKESGGEGMLRKAIAKFFTLLVSVPEN